MERAASTLNLSRAPKTMRDDVRFESTLLLKEIFDYIEMPALESHRWNSNSCAGPSAPTIREGS